MIERLIVHHFRGIREGVLKDCGKVNLLVGPNNSGKTAILEMLYLAGVNGRECGLVLEDGSRFEARAPLPHDLLGYVPLLRLLERHGRATRQGKLYGDLTEEKGLWFHLHNLPESHPLHRFILAVPEKPRINRDFLPEDVQTVALFTLQHPRGLPLEMVPQKIKDEASPETLQMTYLWHPDFVFNYETRKEPLDHLAIWASEGAGCDPERVLFFDFHVAHDHFRQHFVDSAYLIPDWHEKIAKALSKVFSDLADCRINTRPVTADQMSGYVERPESPPLPIDYFGDGARHAFKVLAGLIALAETVDERHPGLFLWEDPELFMHPLALERLLAEVMDWVRQREIQVFISTHSMETIAYLTRYASKDKQFAERLRAFRLGNKKGRLFYATFKYTNLFSWLQDGMDPRFWGIADTALSYNLKNGNEDE